MLTDIRDAWRAFTRAPGFTLTAALTLAVGIGANTAIFTVVYALLLKPLPFREPARIVYVHDTFPEVSVASVSFPKFVALHDGNRTLTSMAATVRAPLTMTGRGEPQQIVTTRVSGDFFDVLGVPPFAGRPLTRADDVPGSDAIVLSHALWIRAFGGDNVVGHTMIADGQPRTIVGVMPPGFAYPPPVEAWVPLALPPSTPDGNNFLRLIGLMKPGVTLADTTADLRAVSAAYNAANNARRDVAVYRLQDYLTQGNRTIVLVLQGAVLLVLLVACANVANMLLARGVSRQRELAIRAALGAAPVRLLRQLLTESVMLAVAGGALGVLLGGWLLRLFLLLAPAGFAGIQSIAIDRQVLVAAAAVAMLTGIVFGVAPARRAFRTESHASLRDAARGSASADRRGVSRLLVIAEIALAMILVVGAGVLMKSLWRLQMQDAGFRAEGLVTFQLALPATRYDDDAARRAVARILADTAAIPGVKAAGAINFLPLLQFGFSGPFAIQGRPPFGPNDRTPVIEYRLVTPGYFTAMTIPVKQGVSFTDRDTADDRPVVIINETMARQYWPDGSPIGARVQLGMDAGAVTREVVGVVGDVRSQALNRLPVPEAYVPHAQGPAGTLGALSIAIRTDGDPAALLPVVRQTIAGIDAALPVVRPQTMQNLVGASTGSMRLSSTLTSVFALLAALLATVGIYSLVAYSVATRTREIGIRIALGAEPSSVLRLIVGEGLSLATIGLGLGLAGTYALVGAMQSMLFEVSALDPIVLIITATAVLLVTALASSVPAWRVMRIDPTVALRSE